MAADTGKDTSGAGAGPKPWPGWLVPPPVSVGDVLALAGLRFDLDRARVVAGVIDAVAWIVETAPGPATGRGEGPHVREVAGCELIAAEHHALEGTGRSGPSVQRVCTQLGVRYVPPHSGDPDAALGVRATLRWALGITHTPPVRLPLRALDGHLLTEEEILPTLLSTGMTPEKASAEATAMAEDSARLAALVRVKNAASS